MVDASIWKSVDVDYLNLLDPVPLSAGREFHKIVARFYYLSKKELLDLLTEIYDIYILIEVVNGGLNDHPKTNL